MWEAMRERVVARGGAVHVSAEVERLAVRMGRVTEVVANGRALAPEHVISSLPLSVLPELVDPAPDGAVLAAARGLRYRDFLTVALVLDGADLFPDNWVYVHDPSVRVARIQNYHSWSPWMVPDPTKTSVGMEYFCFAGDELWSLDDDALVALATAELDRIGLASREVVERGWVVRVPRAYPIYDADYAQRVATIRAWLDGIVNLQQIGRNGLHRYNNSDHSMLTAICAVENLRGARHDVWTVNTDSWYGEERADAQQPYRHAQRVAPGGAPASSGGAHAAPRVGA
jgi:protoporphyrinogen oxidase